MAVDQTIANGATGIETSVWTTADGVVVANRTGQQRKKFRKVAVSRMKFAELDSSSSEFDALLRAVGLGSIHLLVGDEDSVDAAVKLARNANAEEQLWLVSDDLALLTRWRTRTSSKLVHSVRIRDLKQGPERFAADLKDRSLDGLEMFHTDWNGGLITMVHRFGLLGIATGAEQPREMANLIDSGIDVLRTTKILRLVETASQFTLGKA